MSNDKKTSKVYTGIVIDDERDAVDSLSEFFELNGICVVAKGYDGEECFQLYVKHKPDFVILDLMMPKYDGVYAIKKIKDEDPNAKIIVVTGFTKYEFNRDDVTAVFTKPFEISEIIKVIKEIC